jgi:hypothetical protein
MSQSGSAGTRTEECLSRIIDFSFGIDFWQ